MSSAAEILASENVSGRPDNDRLLARIISVRLRYFLPMIVIFSLSYIGLTVLAGLDKELVSRKVLGPLNLGFVLIGADYVVAWIVTLGYVHIANTKIDPLVDEIANGMEARR